MSYDYTKHYKNLEDVNNIIIGKTYIDYDDGKIKPSRESEVVIIEKIPFKKASVELHNMWVTEVETCHWLYNPVTDYFLKTSKDEYYVRTLNNGWFSIGWGGRLYETPVDFEEVERLYNEGFKDE